MSFKALEDRLELERFYCRLKADEKESLELWQGWPTNVGEPVYDVPSAAMAQKFGVVQKTAQIPDLNSDSKLNTNKILQLVSEKNCSEQITKVFRQALAGKSVEDLIKSCASATAAAGGKPKKTRRRKSK